MRWVGRWRCVTAEFALAEVQTAFADDTEAARLARLGGEEPRLDANTRIDVTWLIRAARHGGVTAICLRRLLRAYLTSQCRLGTIVKAPAGTACSAAGCPRTLFRCKPHLDITHGAALVASALEAFA